MEKEQKKQEHRLPPLQERQSVEIDLLLEAVHRVYGFDFRGYSRYSLDRRVLNMLREENIPSVSHLQALVMHDPDAMERLLLQLSVNVTTMFRDPSFFAAFREKVVPYLFAHPYVRIWHAGCASGEEVYSLAILLHEEGLLERARIYATDMDMVQVEKAKAGIYPMGQMKEFTANYVKAGGKHAFSSYYTAQYDHAILKAWLRKNIVFAQHNLATDSSFNEFNVIFCRNVLIYFDKVLQTRVHQLLYQSLRRFGVLALGNRETIWHTAHERDYETIDDVEHIYRKAR